LFGGLEAMARRPLACGAPATATRIVDLIGVYTEPLDALSVFFTERGRRKTIPRSHRTTPCDFQRRGHSP
jgi:hypothetical protein